MNDRDGKIVFFKFDLGPHFSRLLYRLGRRNKNISINVLWLFLAVVLIVVGCAWRMPPPPPGPVCPPELLEHNLCA